jgi:hypothetical protein
VRAGNAAEGVIGRFLSHSNEFRPISEQTKQSILFVY